MVPFSEVVLLTAMEYYRKDKTEEKKKTKRKKKKSKKNKLSKSINIVSETDKMSHRKDDDLEQRGDTSLQMVMDEKDEDYSVEQCYLRWIPDLKTVGRCNSFDDCIFVLMAEYILTIILSERKVLPSLVLTSYIVYFVIALNFYFDG